MFQHEYEIKDRLGEPDLAPREREMLVERLITFAREREDVKQAALKRGRHMIEEESSES